MSIESPLPSDNKVTPLSQGLGYRKASNSSTPVDDKPVTESTMREVFSETVGPLLIEVRQLKESVNRMADQFEAIRNGESEDAALRVTTDSEATDIALASVELSKELNYPYTCNQLADKLGVRPYDVKQMIRSFSLKVTLNIICSFLQEESQAQISILKLLLEECRKQ